MSHPSINDAKALAYRHRKTGVLILHVGGGQYGGATYGMTRAQCRAMGKVLDQISSLIESGRIKVPDELMGSPPEERYGPDNQLLGGLPLW